MKKGVDFTSFQRIETPDGSYTLQLPKQLETYHSVYGARTESSHVFIQNGIQCLNKTEIVICETGFGTGLNALLSLQYAHSNQIRIHYEACETMPLSAEMLPPPAFIEGNAMLRTAWQSMHLCSWNELHPLTERFTLRKAHLSINEFIAFQKADIWFHDAFSPRRQPEMWTSEVFSHIAGQFNENGFLVTYSAAGKVKNALRESGFRIQRLPGPPGKKHMLRAYW